MFKHIKYYLILLLLIIIQNRFIWLISISSYNIFPDLVLIMVTYIGIKKGKITGCIAGFAAGILLDILAGSFIGLSALSYTLAGFIAGFFYESDPEKMRAKRLLTIITLTVFVSSFIYYEIYFVVSPNPQSFIEIIYKFVAPTMVYTVLVGLILIFFPKRKSTSSLYSN